MQKKRTGLRLSPSVKTVPETGWQPRTVMALSATVITGLSAAQLAGLSAPGMWAMVLTGACVCGIYGILGYYKKQNRFLPGLLAAAAISILLGREPLLEGMRVFWNRLSAVRVGSTGWVLPALALQKTGNSRLYEALFSSLLGGMGGIFFCLTVSGSASAAALALPVLVTGAMAYLGSGVSFRCLTPVLIVSVLLLTGAGWERRSSAKPLAMGWLLYGTALVLAVEASMVPGLTRWADQAAAKVERSVHTHKYETEATTLPEGDFTQYRRATGSAQGALTVTMEVPEELYLRGFTGDVFENNRWKGLETEYLKENAQLLYWLNLEAFDPDAQFEAAAKTCNTLQSTVTVQNTGACSRYLYVPFGLCAGEYLCPEDLNTGGVNGNGSRMYTYTGICGGAEEIARVLEYLQTSQDPAVQAYRKAESAYREFVYDAYLRIPSDAKELLQKRWEDILQRYENTESLTLQQAQESALLFLSRCFPEEGTPADMELPLDAARGTAFQYATVAALTLRYYGIPARYAEGYVITEQMAADAKPGEPIRVDGSCARAWVEVYQDGIGWIPMELTPGIGQVLQQVPDDSLTDGEGTDEDSRNETEDPEKQKTPDRKSPLAMPEGGSVTAILSWALWNLLRLLLLPALTALLLWLRRKRRLEMRQQRFRLENRNDAIGWIFADTAILLEKLGLSRQNGSMRPLCEPARTRFGEEFSLRLREMIDLNDRAVFSSRPLTEAQREQALAFREQTVRLLREKASWYKHFWMKWIRCLY